MKNEWEVAIMPNWCQNELIVVGNKKELERFKERACNLGRRQVIDAEGFIPYDKHYQAISDLYEILEPKYGWRTLTNDEIKEIYTKHPEAKELGIIQYNRIVDGYNQGGYDWCIKNWGTKWGFFNSRIIDDNYSFISRIFRRAFIKYTFETAWSPPIPVIEEMARQFPKLRFEMSYFEIGHSYEGKIIIKGTKVLEKSFSKDYTRNHGR